MCFHNDYGMVIKEEFILGQPIKYSERDPGANEKIKKQKRQISKM